MIILKIIGVLLLIIIALVFIASCIPVCIGVKYDNTVSIVIKYLFIRYEYSFDKSKAKQMETETEPTPWRKIKNAFKRGLLAVCREIRRAFSAIKSVFSKVFKSVRAAWVKSKRKFKVNFKSKRDAGKKKSDSRKKSSKTTSSDKNLFQSLREEHGFWGAIGVFVSIGEMLGGSFVKIYNGVAVNRFILHVEISGADPADTAIKYGRVCAFAFPALSYILSNMRRYDQDIDIIPNFEADKDTVYFDGEFVVFSISVARHVLTAGFKFFIKQIKLSLKK